MPGIAGVITKMPKERADNILLPMLNCMMHEPTYSSGTFQNEDIGIYTGWVCHEQSFSDCMPVLNEKKDIALIFFGENYADLAITDELKKKNHLFNRTNANY